MKEQEQRIALCEWMGWSGIVNNPCRDPHVQGFAPHSKHLGLTSLPDTNSLDVLHEMEKKLTVDQASDYYWSLQGTVNLIGIPCEAWVYHATASQRREALLRTLGLWKD